MFRFRLTCILRSLAQRMMFTLLMRAVYMDNDRTRDMTDGEVVRAIANLEATGVTLTSGFWPLNNYRW